MNRMAKQFLDCILANQGIGNKPALIRKCVETFNLTKDRSVYLSNLQKYDDIPFFVCLVTKTQNRVFLANSTFLSKISHSSHELRLNNIRGSFNGSDIMKEFNGITNEPQNFEQLFNIHAGLGFEANLPRLVEATTNIVPSGEKFCLTPIGKTNILDSEGGNHYFSAEFGNAGIKVVE